MSEENNCFYVCSRGILKSCDIYCLSPNSSDPQIINYNEDLVNNNTNNYKTIYICNTAMKNFIHNYSNKITYKYVLVTGDCDETVPVDIFNGSEEDFLNFIENNNLIHWYSQNCISDHPKITRIPIGLDYHTLSKHDYYWGPMLSPIGQEREFMQLSLKNTIKPFWKRQIKCYSNFHFSMPSSYKFFHDRVDAVNKVPRELVFYEEKQITRLETSMRQCEFAFVLSPHGNGLDCHRTWEALVLGCIPIVKTSKIDKLYEELPVLIVNDWSDISYHLLETTVNDFSNKKFNYEKLMLSYWINKIKSHSQ